MILTEIENLLLALPQIAAVNRRANPLYTGGNALPAVGVEYAWTVGEDVHAANYRDVLTVIVTTPATDGAVGVADIDAHLALCREITQSIESYQSEDCRNALAHTSGGPVSRASGFCNSELTFVRNRVQRRAA